MDDRESLAKVPSQGTRRVARQILPYWIVGIIVLSFLPGRDKRWLGTDPFILHHPVTWQHRSGHFFAFGTMAVLLLLGTTSPSAKTVAAASATFLGITIETGQYVLGLSPLLEWWDIRDDVVGILFGIALTKLLLGFVEMRGSRKT
jgi:hypothetical protein